MSPVGSLLANLRGTTVPAPGFKSRSLRSDRCELRVGASESAEEPYQYWRRAVLLLVLAVVFLRIVILKVVVLEDQAPSRPRLVVQLASTSSSSSSSTIRVTDTLYQSELPAYM
eukprot:3534378-Rhodomonas_salina.2